VLHHGEGKRSQDSRGRRRTVYLKVSVRGFDEVTY
jgi:hypothetical protein